MSEELSYYGPSRQYDAVKDVIGRLPEDVQQWALKNVTFICVDGFSSLSVNVGCRCRRGETNLIVLGPQEGKTVDEIVFSIAHELAHVKCGHPNYVSNRDEYQTKEDEADAIANSWGFPGKSVRVSATAAENKPNTRSDSATSAKWLPINDDEVTNL